jgi:hypothetical protein
MVIIQVQIGKNFIEDVFLDGSYRINIVMEKLKVFSCLSKPKHAPYSLCMVD